MRLRSILIPAVVVLMAGTAQAQLVVRQVLPPISIDNDILGCAEKCHGQGSEGEAWGMAYDHNTNTLYWNNGTTLYKSPFSLAGLTPTLVGTITYQGAASSIVGLGYRNGKLLGTKNITTEAVYEIDPVTAVSTLLYASRR